MRDLTYAELDRLTFQGHCPYCGSGKFGEGPHGGMSVNIFCSNPECKAGFNIAPGIELFGQLIRDPVGGVPETLWGDDTIRVIRKGREIRAEVVERVVYGKARKVVEKHWPFLAGAVPGGVLGLLIGLRHTDILTGAALIVVYAVLLSVILVTIQSRRARV